MICISFRGKFNAARSGDHRRAQCCKEDFGELGGENLTHGNIQRRTSKIIQNAINKRINESN